MILLANNLQVAVCGLLAQASNWQRLGDKFSGRKAQIDASEVALFFAVFAGAGLLLWLLHWVANRHEQSSTKPNPKRLFNELCHSHSLPRGDRTTLRLLAEAAELEQPVEVFLRPDLFELANIPAAARGDAKAIETIGRVIFQDLHAPPAENEAKRSVNAKPENTPAVV